MATTFCVSELFAVEDFMASINHDILINCPAADVWDAVRDVGALHSGLVPGFVVETTMVQGGHEPRGSLTFCPTLWPHGSRC